ncbi:MAG: Ku protein [Polyangiaceae bacterium]|nr:Ku protein [Myxococcales bacterium]MCB9589526.1 Ku protein [Polyangiaceae bacterium]MCB9609154.1 Ku protein [Polyangiaceae bacterium]
MAARAISSGTISFGLVSIPIKLFTAASSQSVSFNMLHGECGNRIKQQLYCPTCDVVVERKDLVKGYEYTKGQFVQFTDEELKKLEAERSSTLEIVEFVPLETVDFIQVEKSYYLGPDKGGDKAYKLLAEAMRRKERVAVGSWSARGKEQLVMIRPYQDGLILHQLYYAGEVRAYDDVDKGATFNFSDAEQDLADKLLDQLTVDEFDSEKFKDAYATRVLEVVDQKVAGQEITLAPEQPKAQIIDLFEALKKSLAQGGDSADEAKESKKAEGKKAKAKPVKKAEPGAKKETKTRAKKTSTG